MSENISKILEFSTEIKSDGSIEFPYGKLKELKKQGYSRIKLLILDESHHAAKELGYDISLIEKIQNVQEIPSDVVIDFLKSKGSITSEEFINRVKY